MTENIVKNAVVPILGGLFLRPITVAVEPVIHAGLNDLLLVISILLVTVCFANFGFSYQPVSIGSRGKRYLAHLATAIFLWLTFVLLETLVVIISRTYPSLFEAVLIFSILLYGGIALHDFWDYSRAGE